MSTFQLVYLPANQAYAFLWCDQLVPMGDNPTFWTCRADAVMAAELCGLVVSRSGIVTAPERMGELV